MLPWHQAHLLCRVDAVLAMCGLGLGVALGAAAKVCDEECAVCAAESLRSSNILHLSFVALHQCSRPSLSHRQSVKNADVVIDTG